MTGASRYKVDVGGFRVGALINRVEDAAVHVAIAHRTGQDWNVTGRGGRPLSHDEQVKLIEAAIAEVASNEGGQDA